MRERRDLRDDAEMRQSLQHAVGEGARGAEGGQMHDGLVQLRLRVFHDDALHARQQEHAAVVAGVAGHEHFRAAAALMRSHSHWSASPLSVLAGSTSRSRALE